MPFQPRRVAARQFASLRVYNYRIFFFGQLVSLIGTWMQTIGQDWLVLQLSDSPLALGTVTTLQFLPVTLLALFGGVFADRVPKRKMLMFTQSGLMLQSLVLGLLVVSGRVELWHVYLLALALGTLNAFDNPVRQAFVVELVGKEQLPNAVALNSSTFNSARVLGPAVGGILIGLVGMSATFFLNAASYIGVLTAYSLMRPAQFQSRPRVAPRGSVFAQLAEGVRYSVKTPAVLSIFILLAFIGAFGFNFTVIIPLVARFVLHVGPEKYGLLTSSMGIGSLIAGLIIAGVGRPTVKLMLTAACVFVVILGAIALSQWYFVTAALLVVLGAAGVSFSTTVNTRLQLIVPDELRGRVMSIFFLLFAGSTPIGGYLTGFLAERIGVSTALGIMAGICAVGIGVAVAYRGAHRAQLATPAAAPLPSSPSAGQ